MGITRLNVSLSGLRIGLSGAVPARNEWSEPAMDRGILDFVSLFTSIVFKYGGRIVHGSHPAFTPVILKNARLHTIRTERKPVTLVVSELWKNQLPPDYAESVADVADLVVTPRVGEGGPENVVTRNQSLTAMRRILIEKQNIMVAVGGKMHANDGNTPGVKEEMDLAAMAAIPRFLVGGMGGYAASYARELIPGDLMNGLNDEQNRLLFSTNDVAASVNLIFQQLLKMGTKTNG